MRHHRPQDAPDSSSVGLVDVELKRGNPSAFQTLSNRLEQLRGLEGKVGWFEDSKYEGTDVPVAGVMALNEHGHGSTPPRPFFRPTATEQKQPWARTALAASKQVVAGAISGVDAMELLTQKAEDDVKETILKVLDPRLSPITIELRAMKKKDPSLRVTGATVGQAATKVTTPGYKTPDVSTKPLIDSGKAIATLTHKVEKT